MPTLRYRFAFDKALVGPLFTFGGWMTVSNIVSPMMVYVDRFLIGSILSLTAVAYYATPYEIVTKLLMVPGALVGVMFPAFSASMAADQVRAAILYRRAAKYVGLFLFPVSLALIVFGQNLLQIWLGHEFAVQSTRALQILSLGVLANGLAAVPFALIQGTGRADITGKLHLMELPFYMAAVWYLTVRYGIVGTAIAWLVRVTADCILLFVIADNVLGSRHRILWPVAGSIGAGAVAVAITPMLGGMSTRLPVAGCVLAVFALIVWRHALSAEERYALHRALMSAA
jgi:O-antigen/teichoic acid export membrane protein